MIINKNTRKIIINNYVLSFYKCKIIEKYDCKTDKLCGVL